MQTARSSGGEISDEEVGSPFDGQGPAQVHQGPIRETDIFPSTEDKDAILTLLGQLKLGTDLTRVSLPVFVQEPRSLLELYADLFSYAPLFVAISDGKTDEDRMLACIRWLLSALFATRRVRTYDFYLFEILLLLLLFMSLLLRTYYIIVRTDTERQRQIQLMR